MVILLLSLIAASHCRSTPDNTTEKSRIDDMQYMCYHSVKVVVSTQSLFHVAVECVRTTYLHFEHVGMRIALSRICLL
jgi:hypothetical protein